MCKPLIRAIDSATIKDQFKLAHLVTYRYSIDCVWHYGLIVSGLRMSRQPGYAFLKKLYSRICSIYWVLRLWTTMTTWQMSSSRLQWTSLSSGSVLLYERKVEISPPLPPPGCYHVKKSGREKFVEKFKLVPKGEHSGPDWCIIWQLKDTILKWTWQQTSVFLINFLHEQP